MAQEFVCLFAQFACLRACLLAFSLACLLACIMRSSLTSVFIMALMGMSVPCFCAPLGAKLRQQTKDVVHPISSDTSLGEYERKTQSPMIWINLHKTDLPSS